MQTGYLMLMVFSALMLYSVILQVTSIHIPSVREIPREEWDARRAAATAWCAAVKAHGQRSGLARPPPEVRAVGVARCVEPDTQSMQGGGGAGQCHTVCSCECAAGVLGLSAYTQEALTCVCGCVKPVAQSMIAAAAVAAAARCAVRLRLLLLRRAAAVRTPVMRHTGSCTSHWRRMSTYACAACQVGCYDMLFCVLLCVILSLACACVSCRS
jgi:hypothetical protein